MRLVWYDFVRNLNRVLAGELVLIKVLEPEGVATRYAERMRGGASWRGFVVRYYELVESFLTIFGFLAKLFPFRNGEGD